jgi:hypothetical protein
MRRRRPMALVLTLGVLLGPPWADWPSRRRDFLSLLGLRSQQCRNNSSIAVVAELTAARHPSVRIFSSNRSSS